MAEEKDALIHRMWSLYRGLDRAHGEYAINGRKKGLKVQGRAQTVLEPVTMELWDKHLSGEQGLGIIPITDDATVKWGAIDIDEYDGLSLEKLSSQVTGLKLPLVVCRTKSGGAHLYLFLGEPVSAELIRSTLTSWAGLLGYSGVEIFPKQIQLASETDVGNWINMPYFNARNTNRFAFVDGVAVGLREFLDYAEGMAITEEELHALEITMPNELDGAPPCLQVLVTHGFPEGTRNNGLFNLGVYAKLRFGDDWEDHLDEYNRDYMDPPLPSSEVTGLVKTLKKKDYFYGCKNPPVNGYCNKELCREATYGISGDDFGYEVTLDSLTKYLTEPPRWVASVDGVRVELTTDDLFNQQRFRRLCMERIHKFTKRQKAPQFEAMIQKAMDGVEVIEVPEDAKPEGQLRHYVEEFCSLPGAKARDELLMGKPWTSDERVYFRSTDLLRYLEQEHVRGWPEARLYTTLGRVSDIQHHQFNVKRRCVQCWSIPVPESQGEEFETTRTDDPLEFA